MERGERGGPISRVIGLSLIHLAAAFLTVLLTADGMDPLTGESWPNRAAATLRDILWYPYDLLSRQIPQELAARGIGVTVGALAISSLFWGAMAAGVWEIVRRARRGRRSRSTPPAPVSRP